MNKSHTSGPATGAQKRKADKINRTEEWLLHCTVTEIAERIVELEEVACTAIWVLGILEGTYPDPDESRVVVALRKALASAGYSIGDGRKMSDERST